MWSCMQRVHDSALNFCLEIGASASVLAESDEVIAPALKTIHKAGRRGGDSIAREGCKHV